MPHARAIPPARASGDRRPMRARAFGRLRSTPTLPRYSRVERRRKLVAAVGSITFLVVAPGVVAGVGPWLVTRWRAHVPVALQGVGAVVIAAGAVVLLQAFTRFVVEGLGTPAPVAETDRLVVG